MQTTNNNNNLKNMIMDKHIIKKTSTHIGGNNIGKSFKIRIYPKYDDVCADRIINPLVVFELNNSDIEFDSTRIFKRIVVQINGHDIDSLEETNQIMIYQKKLGLEVRQIGQKVFFPIPIECLNGFIPMPNSIMNILFQFTNNAMINYIDNIEFRNDVVIFDTKPDLKNQIIPINHVNYESVENIMSQGNTFCFYISVGYLEIKNILLYLSNKLSDTIYKEKCFEQIEFIFNGRIILSIDYETLVYESYLLNPNLPKGVYQVNWAKYHNGPYTTDDYFNVRVVGNCVPDPNIDLHICTDNDAFFTYLDDGIGLKKYDTTIKLK